MEDVLNDQLNKQQGQKHNPGQVKIHDIGKNHIKLVNFFGDVSTEVFTLKVSQNNKMVAAGCSNGEAKLYDIYDGNILKISNTSRLSGYPTTGIQWKPIKESDFVACNCDGTIKWYSSN